MAIALHGSFKGTSTSTSANSFSPALTGWTTADPAAGDIVFITGFVMTPAVTWSQTAGTGTWTLHTTGDSNAGGGGMTSFAAFRVFDGTETTPTFTSTGAANRNEWSAVAFTPDAGNTVSVDTWATTLVGAASTTFTANPVTCASTGEVSLILHHIMAAAVGTTGVTFTKETGWSNLAAAAQAGTASAYSGNLSAEYKLAVSGTVTPGAYTTGISCISNAYHVVIREIWALAGTAAPSLATSVTPLSLVPETAAGTASATSGASAAFTALPLAGTAAAASSATAGLVPQVLAASATASSSATAALATSTVFNNAEGGTALANVSVANSGGASGTAWTTVTTGAGASLTYDALFPCDGTLCYWVQTGAGVVTAFAQWGPAVFGPGHSRLYARGCYRLSSMPPTGGGSQPWRIAAWFSSGTFCGALNVTQQGQLRMEDTNHAQLGTMTTVLTVGQYFRTEAYIDFAAGVAEWKLWLDPWSGGTPDEVITTAAGQLFGGNPDTLQFGMFPYSGADYRMDNLAGSPAGYLGPVTGTVPLAGVSAAVSVTTGVFAPAAAAGTATAPAVCTAGLNLVPEALAATASAVSTASAAFLPSVLAASATAASSASAGTALIPAALAGTATATVSTGTPSLALVPETLTATAVAHSTGSAAFTATVLAGSAAATTLASAAFGLIPEALAGSAAAGVSASAAFTPSLIAGTASTASSAGATFLSAGFNASAIASPSATAGLSLVPETLAGTAAAASSAAAGPSLVPEAIAATATAVASASAAFTGAAVTGTAFAQAAAAAAFGLVPEALSAAATATGSAAAGFAGASLAATAIATSSATAAFAPSALAAAAAGSVSATAAFQPATLAGTATGHASATAAFQGASLAGSAAATAIATIAFLAAALAATAAGTPAAMAGLSLVPETLAGTAAAHATTSAAFTPSPLAGTATGTSTGSASFTPGLLGATATGSAQASVTIAAVTAITGTATASSTGTVAMATITSLAGTAAGTGIAAGTLTLLVPFTIGALSDSTAAMGALNGSAAPLGAITATTAATGGPG